MADTGKQNGSGQRSKGWWRLSLSQAVMLGLVLGVSCGLFFGEKCAGLSVIGDAFIGLLQMTILPYIVISLIANIGGLKPSEAGFLAGRIGMLMLVFWVIGLLMVCLMPIALPTLTTASFFSASSVAESRHVNFIELYIPANPFKSLADNVIPAAVLFSIAIGVALIRVEKKQALIDQMRVLSDALVRVSHFVAKLTPVGVFAITASAAGTMTIGELERIQGYLLIYAAGALLLTFWVLPVAVSMLTPFRYRDVLRHCKDALVVAVTTANVFIALPLMITAARNLFEEYQMDVEESSKSFEVVLPIVFSFPNVGKLLLMVFVPFAGWFTGNPLELFEYPEMMISGLLSFFGSVAVAFPFLLDMFEIPADMFELYLVTSIVVGRLASLGAVMHLVALSLLAACMTQKMVKFRPVKLVAGIAVTVAVLGISVGGLRVYLGHVLEGKYTKDQVIGQMQILTQRVKERVYLTPPDRTEVIGADVSRLELILERGVLRVGYEPKRIPWSFFNSHGDLVGYDVELANHLAEELGVSLEFVPIDRMRFTEQLSSGEYDVMMAGMPLTAQGMARARYAGPYISLTPCIVVADYLRQEFNSAEQLREMKNLRLGVPQGKEYLMDDYIRWIRQQMPHAELIDVDSAASFFEDPQQKLDGMFMAAEAGYAWTLLYPKYTVVVPPELNIKVPMGYPVADDERLAQFMDHWLILKKENGTLNSLYDHWVLGKMAEPVKPRWCIGRDVLGWWD